jgi:hypothetical protein
MASSAASIQVADVTFHELESRCRALESLHERQVVALTGAQIVQDAHALAAVQQFSHDIGAYEPRPTRHEK